MFKPVKYRQPCAFDSEEASREAAEAIGPPGESLTVQSMAEDVDLNVIMKRFGVTGKMPDNARPIFYGDFDGITDFRTAQHALIAARESFDAMPAEVRSRFANDPQMFLEFCENPANLEDMRKMGLAIPKEKADAGIVQQSGSPPRADAQASAGGGRGDGASAPGGSSAGSSAGVPPGGGGAGVRPA